MAYEKPEAMLIKFDNDVIATSNTCYAETGAYGDFKSCSKIVTTTQAEMNA